ncbi:glycyl-radical enzyme activating protein [Acidobacteriota bacterium]
MTTNAVSAETAGTMGRVFNIQRCSVHDGPGIRTTVFLKGCPLSCSWCHNPEGIDEAPVLMISADRCLTCGACSEACPVEEGGAAPAGELWDRGACTRCGSCVEACPADARKIAGRDYEVDELVDVLERDRVFFDTSGGGVTFSGGEPLAQSEFLTECLRECRRRGLHMTVDTCGLAPRETLLEVARLCDLVLYDLKHMDPIRHRSETGSDNRLILENLQALSENVVDVWIRLPLIPGFNNDAANIEATGAFLEKLPRKHRVFVLPYHGIANGKRSRLDEIADRSSLRSPQAEELGAVAEALAAHNFEVIVGGSP